MIQKYDFKDRCRTFTASTSPACWIGPISKLLSFLNIVCLSYVIKMAVMKVNVKNGIKGFLFDMIKSSDPGLTTYFDY